MRPAAKLPFALLPATMATAKKSEKMKDKSHEDVVQMLFEVMKAERRLEKENEDLQRRLQQKTDEVERLQTEVEQKEAGKKMLWEVIETMTYEKARHARAIREVQDGTKHKI